MEGKKVKGCHHYWTLKFVGMQVTSYVLLFRKSGDASGTLGNPSSAGPVWAMYKVLLSSLSFCTVYFTYIGINWLQVFHGIGKKWAKGYLWFQAKYAVEHSWVRAKMDKALRPIFAKSHKGPECSSTLATWSVGHLESGEIWWSRGCTF